MNGTSQHHVFACPIDARAATPALPLAEANHLVFSGGIALSSMPSVEGMRLAGAWNLAGDWHEPPSGTIVKSGSTVTVSGTLSEGYNIVVQANATLQVANATASQGTASKNRFLFQNEGAFIVTGEMVDMIQSGDAVYSLAGLFANGNNRAVTRVNGLVHGGSTQGGHQFMLNNSVNSATNTIVLGAGGSRSGTTSRRTRTATRTSWSTAKGPSSSRRPPTGRSERIRFPARACALS